MEKKEFDVLVIGELNVDLILDDIKSFPELGKEKIAKNMTLTLGSSSAIFASNLSVLGAKVAFLGKIGNDYFGKFTIDRLVAKGVDVSHITKDQYSSTGVTVVLNFNEERAMVTYQGAMGNLTRDDITSKILSKASHLHISSFFLQPGLRDDVAEIFKQAKNMGMTTSFDTQWDPEERWSFDDNKILQHVDIFLPNKQELLKLTHQDSVEKALGKLSQSAKNIVVKMGSKGSVLMSNGKSIYKDSFLNANVFDTIGAGDSFNAGFVYKFINGDNLEKCLVFGNLMGAVNTTAAGGTTAFTSCDDVMRIARKRFGYRVK